MALAQEQQQVQMQIADLRVHVETLAGKLDTMNERLTNTNTVLNKLDGTLREQTRQASANRKWIVGTFLASVGIAVSIIAIFLKMP
jgi:peptidoglycan hydrolase CwlO-like protein